MFLLRQKNAWCVLVGKACVLKPEALTDGLRILFLKEGLFYEGYVKEVMPPDV